jgi:hypothetical protein
MAMLVAPQRLPRKIWTVADLYRRFGSIAFERIRHEPPPGCGTVEDVVRLNDHEDRLYELVDGILVEKSIRGIQPRSGWTVAMYCPISTVLVGEMLEIPKRPSSNSGQKKNGPRSGKKNAPRRGRWMS